MTPLEKQLAEALESARTKLEQYYEQTKGVYGGGRPYNYLMRDIDRALQNYDAQLEQEQNSVPY